MRAALILLFVVVAGAVVVRAEEVDLAAVVDLPTHAQRKRVTRSARILLEDFAERFDRSFLPVAEFKVP